MGAGSGTWAEVVDRKDKRRAKTQAKTAAKPSSKKRGSGGKSSKPKSSGKGKDAGVRAARRVWVPSTAAIAVSKIREDAHLGDAMKTFRMALPDIGTRFGITELMPARSAIGGLLMLISGKDHEKKEVALFN